MLGMTNPTAPIHSQPLQHSLFSQLTARAGWLLPAIPEPVLRIFGSRTNSDGDRLDSDVRASSLVTDLMHPADYSQQSVEATRAVVEDAAYMAGGHVTQVGSVVEERIRGVRVRHYRPTGAVSPDEDLPTLVYFHGGGWVVGLPRFARFHLPLAVRGRPRGRALRGLPPGPGASFPRRAGRLL